MGCSIPVRHFNPLPPHGGRHFLRGCLHTTHNISIHSLRMEGDVVLVHCLQQTFQFQSTPSAWRETTSGIITTAARTFQSTPSAWRETSLSRLEIYRQSNFNPLPPHGGRPPTERDDKRRLAISIHSLRMEGDIKRYLITVRRMEISIHSLRMEGDFRSWHCVDRTDISIHSLRMEGDI